MFRSQAIFGMKEFRLVSHRVRDFNAKFCSYAGLDQLCLQMVYDIVGFNANNLNTVGGIYVLIYICCLKARNAVINHGAF